MVPRLQPLALVAAVAKNGVIGQGGTLPWRYPEDLQHFRRTTMGHAVIMGRRTWESLGRALAGRRNLVVTRQADLPTEGAERFSSVEAAIAAARTTDGLPFIIGGAALYAETLPFATHLFLTEIDATPEGDTLFPEWNRAEWVEVERSTGATPGLSFVLYERRNA